MSSFFTTPASQRKRKRPEGDSNSAAKRRDVDRPSNPAKQRKSAVADDESISGSDSDDNDNARDNVDGSEASEDDRETAAERRLRLAEKYLDTIRADVQRDQLQDGEFDAADLDREIISARLKEDVAEEKGRIYRSIATTLDLDTAERRSFRFDSEAVTGVATCSDVAFIVTADRSLSKWRLATPTAPKPTNPVVNGSDRVQKHNPFGRKRPKQIKFTKGDYRKYEDKTYKHHAAPILCVAASADGRFVVTGGCGHRYWNPRINAYAFSGRMIVWDTETLHPLKIFNDHRDAVTSLAFRGRTNQLFCGSRDRTIKIYSLDELAYVETLFGHQDEVVDVAAVGGSQERCVSVGARDRTARLWKVVDESQLIFRGGGGSKKKRNQAGEDEEEWDDKKLDAHEGSIDRVVQLDTQLFVTGADNGDLALFGLHKKKPLHICPHAHGWDPPIPVEESSAEANLEGRDTQGKANPRGITALAAVPFSDLLISGSWEGCLRIWRVNNDTKKLEHVGVLGKAEDVRDKLMRAYGEIESTEPDTQSAIRGVVNSISIFERGDRGKDGLCVLAAHGKTMRLNAGAKFKHGKNGCAIFEIPRMNPEQLHDVNRDVDISVNGPVNGDA